MPSRLRVTEGDREWIAEVDGRRVSLDDASADAGARAGVALEVHASDDGRFRVIRGDDADLTAAVAADGDVVWVDVDGEVFEVRVSRGAPRASASRDQDALSAPMSATVVRVAVKIGDAVQQGDVLIALEAMKMELPIRAPRDGIVRAVHCREGDLVQPGTALVEI
jgi:biotin carboxyl carrier protein